MNWKKKILRDKQIELRDLDMKPKGEELCITIDKGTEC